MIVIDTSALIAILAQEPQKSSGPRVAAKSRGPCPGLRGFHPYIFERKAAARGTIECFAATPPLRDGAAGEEA